MGEEVVFEYAPEEPKLEEEAWTGSRNQDRDVVQASLRVGEAFALFDAAALDSDGRSRPRSSITATSSYEAPRAKLARLQREAADLKSEVEATPEAYDGASATDLLHDVDDLIQSLERMAVGLPPRPASKTFDEAKRAAEEAAAKAAAGLAARADLKTTSSPGADEDVAALGGGPATAKLVDEASTASLPASIVARLAALRGLHEAGFEFASRLRTVELEQGALRAALHANDATAKRIVDKLQGLLAERPS